MIQQAPFLGTYSERRKSLNQKDTDSIAIFIAALFTITKAWVWKQPKCPLTDEWIKMCVYTHTHTHTHTHTMESYYHKKEQNNAICSNMDGPSNDHTK